VFVAEFPLAAPQLLETSVTRNTASGFLELDNEVVPFGSSFVSYGIAMLAINAADTTARIHFTIVPFMTPRVATHAAAPSITLAPSKNRCSDWTLVQCRGGRLVDRAPA